MGVQVDEAGADDEAAGIRREIRRRRLPGEAEDLSVFQKDVQPRVDAPGRVDNPPVSDQVFHSVPLLLLFFVRVLSGEFRSRRGLRPPCVRAASVIYCPQHKRKDRCT